MDVCGSGIIAKTPHVWVGLGFGDSFSLNEGVSMAHGQGNRNAAMIGHMAHWLPSGPIGRRKTGLNKKIKTEEGY